MKLILGHQRPKIMCTTRQQNVGQPVHELIYTTKEKKNCGYLWDDGIFDLLDPKVPVLVLEK